MRIPFPFLPDTVCHHHVRIFRPSAFSGSPSCLFNLFSQRAHFPRALFSTSPSRSRKNNATQFPQVSTMDRAIDSPRTVARPWRRDSPSLSVLQRSERVFPPFDALPLPPRQINEVTGARRSPANGMVTKAISVGSCFIRGEFQRGTEAENPKRG